LDIKSDFDVFLDIFNTCEDKNLINRYAEIEIEEEPKNEVEIAEKMVDVHYINPINLRKSKCSCGSVAQFFRNTKSFICDQCYAQMENQQFYHRISD